jgi:signal peptidase II
LKRLFNYIGLFSIAGIVIGLDQWTKSLVRNGLPEGGTWLPAGWEALAPYARIIHWYNSGAAFGMFQGKSLVFTILAFVVTGLIIYYYPQVEDGDWWLKLAMGMQMGGALGNVVDRLMFNGNVTDFISVGTFPVFNVADSSISVGVVILLLGVWLKETAEKKKAAAGAVAPNLEPAPVSDESGETKVE